MLIIGLRLYYIPYANEEVKAFQATVINILFLRDTVHTSLGTSRPPTKPLSHLAASRPLLQKRPHSKPNSGADQNYHKQHSTNSTSQITRRPQSGISSTYEKRPEEDRHHGSNNHHHHHHHHGHNHHQQHHHSVRLHTTYLIFVLVFVEFGAS
jgi:hypothetical protein